jgi:hypothetical protein
MQIKKTQLAKIIRDEIANVIEEARRYGEFGDTRRSHAYRTRRATSSSERLRKDRLRAAQIKHGKEEYAAGRADFEAGKAMDEDPTRHGQYKAGYMDAKAEAEGVPTNEGQIKKTQLVKIIRDEIANAVNEERSYGRRRQRSMDSKLQIAKSRALQYEKEKDSLEMGYNDAMAGEPRKSEKLAYNRAYDRALGKMDAEARKPKSPPEGSFAYHYNQGYDKPDEAELMKEDEIQAARYNHKDLPGNPKPGQVGNAQQLEEVGLISTFMDPAMFAGLSPATQAALAFLDPFLTVSGVGLVSSALMTYLTGPNKKMPSVAKIPDSEALKLMQAFQKVERKIGSDKVDEPEERKAALDTLRRELSRTPKRKEEPAVDAGIPADELGAKR